MKADFLIEDHGSVVLITAVSQAAKDEANALRDVTDPWQWLGGKLIVDHRVALNLITTLAEEGFSFA